jgi:hypothetical protein
MEFSCDLLIWIAEALPCVVQAMPGDQADGLDYANAASVFLVASYPSCISRVRMAAGMLRSSPDA